MSPLVRASGRVVRALAPAEVTVTGGAVLWGHGCLPG